MPLQVSSWFRSSLDSSARPDLSQSEPRPGGKPGGSRRNSEGSRGSASGLARALRQSFRREKGGRVRTESCGSLGGSREVTPRGSTGTVQGEEGREGKLRKKLSFDGDASREGEGAATGSVQASPGEPLPGEVFPLQVLWYCGEVELLYSCAMVSWYCGEMVLFCTVVLWYRGTVVR